LWCILSKVRHDREPEAGEIAAGFRILSSATPAMVRQYATFGCPPANECGVPVAMEEQQGDGSHAPRYLTYDQIGSPRLVTDAADNVY